MTAQIDRAAPAPGKVAGTDFASWTRIGDFFCWLAGAHLRTLRRTPTDRSFYVALGASLLVPFALGVAGAAVVGHVVTDHPAVDARLVGLAVGWGFLIVIVDRLLLTVRMEAEAKLARKALFTLMRVCLAVGTAIVVTEPLLSVWFSDEAIAEARTELSAEKAQDRRQIASDFEKRRADVLAAAGPRQREIEAEIARLQQQIDANNHDAAEARRQCDDELGGRNGGDPGDGPQASRLCRFAEQADAQATATSDTANAQIRDLQKELVSLRAPLDVLAENQSDALGAIDNRGIQLDDLGLWRRIELTHKVLSWWWLLALAGTLIVLDTMPVVLKALRGPTAHDELLKATREEVSSVSRIESEGRVDAANHAREQAAVERVHRAALSAEQRRLEVAAARARADTGVEVAHLHVDTMPPIDWREVYVAAATDARPDLSHLDANGDEPRSSETRRSKAKLVAASAVTVVLAASALATTRVLDTRAAKATGSHVQRADAKTPVTPVLPMTERCARIEADESVRQFVDVFPAFVVGSRDAREVMASIRGSLAKPFVGTPVAVRDAASRLADEVGLVLRHSRPDIALTNEDVSRLVDQVEQLSSLLDENCHG